MPKDNRNDGIKNKANDGINDEANDGINDGINSKNNKANDFLKYKYYCISMFYKGASTFWGSIKDG